MKKQDCFSLLGAGQTTLRGWLGEALDLSIENRLKKVDYAHLEQPFRDRQESDGRWRCEFWGKIVRSAIRSWRAKPDAELKALIDATVRGIIATQTEEGCVSSYPAEKQTTDWDVWGRKYVLLGLARYCHVIEDRPEIREAMVRILDHLMTQVGPGAKTMVQSGHHTGMAPSSILGAVLQVYWLTGEKRFLDYAEWIVDEGGSPVFEQVMKGEKPCLIGNGKAYEMTSCVEGMLELYRETGREGYLEAIMTYFQNVVEQEIFITGVGGLKDCVGEYWCEGTLNQATKELGGRGETCVTTTFIRFCLNILRLTGDVRAAEEGEKALYNGILGEMVPDGSWWMHLNPTPLSAPAPKVRAGDQLPGYGEDCCLAQGPEALATAALMAVMKAGDDVVINFFESSHVTVDESMSLAISGDYPAGGQVRVAVALAQPRYCALRLRIPAWSAATELRLNGQPLAVAPGSYAVIERVWQNGDVLDLTLDVRLQVIDDPSGSGLKALKMGPLVLARDSRLGDVNAPYVLPVTAERVAARPGMKAVYKLNDGTFVCDYASAGNEFSPENTLRVFC